MMAEALAALVSTGGTALVTAMVTDGWEDVKADFARLFGRGDPELTKAVAERLEQSRASLGELSGPDLDRARVEQETIWRTRLGDVLERDPAAETELRALVAKVQADVIGWAGAIEQHAVAFHQAQQAVQGQGVQNVTFGGQYGPEAS